MQIEEGVYQPKVFSETGLLAQLRQAVLFLKKGEIYEAALDTYDIILELYQHQRDCTCSFYSKCAAVYVRVFFKITLSRFIFKKGTAVAICL